METNSHMLEVSLNDLYTLSRYSYEEKGKKLLSRLEDKIKEIGLPENPQDYFTIKINGKSFRKGSSDPFACSLGGAIKVYTMLSKLGYKRSKRSKIGKAIKLIVDSDNSSKTTRRLAHRIELSLPRLILRERKFNICLYDHVLDIEDDDREIKYYKSLLKEDLLTPIRKRGHNIDHKAITEIENTYRDYERLIFHGPFTSYLVMLLKKDMPIAVYSSMEDASLELEEKRVKEYIGRKNIQRKGLEFFRSIGEVIEFLYYYDISEWRTKTR